MSPDKSFAKNETCPANRNKEEEQKQAEVDRRLAAARAAATESLNAFAVQTGKDEPKV